LAVIFWGLWEVRQAVKLEAILEIRQKNILNNIVVAVTRKNTLGQVITVVEAAIITAVVKAEAAMKDKLVLQFFL
jgi:hypothetical protein